MHGTLRFLFLSYQLYEICVKIFVTNRYSSNSYTTTKNTIDRQHTERGQLHCQLLLVTLVRRQALGRVFAISQVNELLRAQAAVNTLEIRSFKCQIVL